MTLDETVKFEGLFIDTVQTCLQGLKVLITYGDQYNFWWQSYEAHKKFYDITDWEPYFEEWKENENLYELLRYVKFEFEHLTDKWERQDDCIVVKQKKDDIHFVLNEYGRQVENLLEFTFSDEFNKVIADDIYGFVLKESDKLNDIIAVFETATKILEKSQFIDSCKCIEAIDNIDIYREELNNCFEIGILDDVMTILRCKFTSLKFNESIWESITTSKINYAVCRFIIDYANEKF